MTGVDAPSRMLDLPRLVLGASRLDRIARDDAFRLLDDALELGITAIDTAAVYGRGQVDVVLGAWLRSRGVRDRVLLIGKGAHPDEHGPRMRPDAIADDLQVTLDRLGTDHLDGFLLHRDDEQVPVAEIVDALDPHVRSGRARAIGASNWTVARIAAALAASQLRGRARFAISSPQLALAVPRTPPYPGCVTLSGHGARDDQAFYAASQLTVLAWSALAAGFLLGRREADGGVYDHAANRARRDRLEALARARGCTATQLALAYVLGAPFRVAAVIRCSTRGHLEECRRALDVALTSDERTQLEGPRLSAPASGAARTRSYDAIVVGSGATGGWAAKQLTEAGMAVLVLEAGPERDPVLAARVPAPAVRPPRQPIQSLHPAFSWFPPELFVDDRTERYATPDDRPFAWIRGRQLGGRTLAWGGVTLRLSDFELQPRDGAGPDWPLAYAELAPWYDRVEAFHGIHGSADGLAQLPDGRYLPPPPMTPAELRLKQQISARWPERTLVHARAMALDELNAETGWPRHTSAGSTLEAARRTGRLTVRTGAIASRLRWDRRAGRIAGVEVIDRATGRTDEVRGRVVVLCASTVETTRLLLCSRDPDWPDGLGNASGVLGRFLMDHPAVIASGWTDAAGDAGMHPFGGPHGVCIPRFRNLGRTDEMASPRGYGVWGGLQRGFAGPDPEAVPVLFIAHGEMLPSADNRIDLDPDARDPWGMPLARISCAISDVDEDLMCDALEFLDELGELGGLRYARGPTLLGPPGVFVHEVGTARMGADRRTSFLNRWNQAWEIPNLFVCDGAAFPSAGWQNPTLTMMALTARACDHIIAACRRREL